MGKGKPQAQGLRFFSFYGLIMGNEKQRSLPMEFWDLYDKDRRPLGRTHQRGLPVPPGNTTWR